MAHKDYVSRGRANKAPPPKPPLPWLRIVITLALFAGFAYFLWNINGSAKKTENSQPAPVKVKEPADALPKPPEEKWEFIEVLPNQTVEVDVPEQEDDGIRWLMQCGSFRQSQQAEEMRAKIAFAGLESQVRPSDGANGRWYRVILGPFERKREAEKNRHAIRRTGITTCQIWQWNLD
ncbi:SPOR domain-containing protein [Bowmanella yangjiangensis]|uniref:SPOR domain-containing protein n=1 Tax=Bowmanella yangjiangensis TaxID=2811230 RepID=A0ABS3CYU7_9ALTE|nr:SPOR domain-containing protein [Bowmanella yangjiangensis]MBN7820779.1 SPOR domain-containing protein [Bowmanella yangjiangensis]